MPRPRIDIAWRNRVRELTEQNPRFSSRKIASQLEKEAETLKRTDWPSEKTVRNIMQEHRAAPDRERRLYGQVYWPESFGTPELPWEAAPAVLEAIRRCEEGKRPTVRTAKWLWRLALAAPDVPAGDWLPPARGCAVSEAFGLPKAEEIWRFMEQQLLYPGLTLREPLPIPTTFDAADGEGVFSPGFLNTAEAEGIFSPEFAERIRELRRQWETQKEEGTES